MNKMISMMIALLAITAFLPSAFAQLEPSANGGGVVGGDPGLMFGASTSQFGFAVTINDGVFQCLMAGFSGGFSIPGTSIAEVLLMDVHGTVDTLTVSSVASYDIHGLTFTGDLATFSGLSDIRIVGKTDTGEVVRMTMTDVPFIVEAAEGRAGTGILHLEHPALELHTGGLVERGNIVVEVP